MKKTKKLLLTFNEQGCSQTKLGLNKRSPNNIINVYRKNAQIDSQGLDGIQ